jgi:hypothetical protein
VDLPEHHRPPPDGWAGTPELLRPDVPGGVRERWGYYWWPGVNVRTRLEATAPEELKDHIRFIRDHRELYEDATPDNELAILYPEGPIAPRPEGHRKYLALAQALAERDVQFDVVYVGDGRFLADDLDREALARYRTVLVPEARDLGETPVAALEAFARAGGDVTVFSESSLDPGLVRQADGELLLDFWRDYRDDDRERIVESIAAPSSARIGSSDPAVRVIRYAVGDRQVIHLLDYRYDEATDAVTPIRDLRLRIPWPDGHASCTMVDLGGEQRLPVENEDGALVVEVPELDPYAVLVVGQGSGEGATA